MTDLYRDLRRLTRNVAQENDAARLRRIISDSAYAIRNSHSIRFDGIDPVIHAMSTARAICQESAPTATWLLPCSSPSLANAES